MYWNKTANVCRSRSFLQSNHNDRAVGTRHRDCGCSAPSTGSSGTGYIQLHPGYTSPFPGEADSMFFCVWFYFYPELCIKSASGCDWFNSHPSSSSSSSVNGHLPQSWPLLSFLVPAGLFCCFHSPPNSDMDYRIFNVHMWSFCMCIHTGEPWFITHQKDFFIKYKHIYIINKSFSHSLSDWVNN